MTDPRKRKNILFFSTELGRGKLLFCSPVTSAHWQTWRDHRFSPSNPFGMISLFDDLLFLRYSLPTPTTCIPPTPFSSLPINPNDFGNPTPAWRPKLKTARIFYLENGTN
ncbi:hypothetical protein TNCT_600101 [Trichonephila clavata]|uniref:Uncharacterized protein n=1 Tax=Trichonephila clavata TaxID=2740835 RepID=A0A8X6ID61_TRICU|nr:hypothetical protein TNCT_600101 [Trichonephila clavata]